MPELMVEAALSLQVAVTVETNRLIPLVLTQRNT